MLTMPIERIAELLDKAAQVDFLEDDAEDENTEEPEEDDPSYQALVDAIDILTVSEVLELLTLARLGDEESDAETWEDAAEEARSVPAETRLDELVEALVLAEGIEAALQALGYAIDEDEGAEDEDEDEDEEDSAEPSDE